MGTVQNMFLVMTSEEKRANENENFLLIMLFHVFYASAECNNYLFFFSSMDLVIICFINSQATAILEYEQTMSPTHRVASTSHLI